MAKDYLNRLLELINRVGPACPSGTTITVKHFFGGAAAFADKRIFMSMTKVGIALKLPEEDRIRLFRSGDAQELRYFPKAPVKKQYALVSNDFFNHPATTKPLIEKSIAFALSEDPKK